MGHEHAHQGALLDASPETLRRLTNLEERYPELSVTEKLLAHREIATREIDDQAALLEGLTRTLEGSNPHGMDPAEAEGMLAELLASRDANAAKLAQLGDALEGGDVPHDLLANAPSLDRGMAERNAFYEKYPTQEARQAKRQDLETKLSDGGASWDDLAELGYRRVNDLIVRPDHLSHDLPAVRVGPGGSLVLSDTAGPAVTHVAPIVPSQRHGTLLSEDDALVLKDLGHPTVPEGFVDRAWDRLGQPGTIGEVLEARRIAQEQKDLARLSPAEAAELASLEAFHTADQASRHAELAAKKRAFGDAHARMTSASELLGEESAHRWVTSQPGMENAKLVSRGSGNNSLDLVYVDTDTGQVMVVEAKGGSARNGVTRKIADGTHAQQGSSEYLVDLLVNHELPRLRERLAELDPNSEAYGELDVVIGAIDDAALGDKVTYQLIQQTLEDGEIGDIKARSFSDAY